MGNESVRIQVSENTFHASSKTHLHQQSENNTNYIFICIKFTVINEIDIYGKFVNIQVGYLNVLVKIQYILTLSPFLGMINTVNPSIHYHRWELFVFFSVF